VEVQRAEARRAGGGRERQVLLQGGIKETGVSRYTTRHENCAAAGHGHGERGGPSAPVRRERRERGQAARGGR
jgi:hypothetical protein